jgi:hypothetical protein
MIILVSNVGVVFATATHLNTTITLIKTTAVTHYLRTSKKLLEVYIHIHFYKANKLGVNKTCLGSYMCDENISLRCWSGYCGCNSSQYYDYTVLNKCGNLFRLSSSILILTLVFILLFLKVDKLPVNETCSGSYMCNENTGLQCLSGICNCNSSQFYDYTFYNNCSKLKHFFTYKS